MELSASGRVMERVDRRATVQTCAAYTRIVNGRESLILLTLRHRVLRSVQAISGTDRNTLEAHLARESAKIPSIRALPGR